MDEKQATPGKVAIGVVAWIGVAVLAVIAPANWEGFWGFLPVAIAVVVAWAVGEWVMKDTMEEGQR